MIWKYGGDIWNSSDDDYLPSGPFGFSLQSNRASVCTLSRTCPTPNSFSRESVSTNRSDAGERENEWKSNRDGDSGDTIRIIIIMFLLSNQTKSSQDGVSDSESKNDKTILVM